MQRIQIDSRPVSLVHGCLPWLRKRLIDSKATSGRHFARFHTQRFQA